MTNRHEPDPYAPNHELRPEDLCWKPQKRYRKRDFVVPSNMVEADLLIAPSSHRRKRKKMHPVLMVFLILLACLLGIALVAFTTLMILQNNGRSAMFPDTPVSLTVPESIEQNPAVEILDDGRIVKYNGETFIFNENRTNILCIGVDKQSLGTESGVVGTGGQADTLIVLSVDTANGDMDALALSRDAMADIDLFAEDGSFVGTEHTQICLAYAYGDGREKSCETTVRAVSRLLYGIPINTYFAIDLGSIATLNDAVGGVEVALLTDFKRTSGTLCKAGDRITLQGEEALWYVRLRDTEQLASNNARMERQKQYLTAFSDKLIRSAKEDLQVPLALFDTVSAQSITSLTPSKITFLTTSLVRHNQPLSFSSVAGNVTKGDDGYAEFHVDDEALYEQVLNIFYTKQ